MFMNQCPKIEHNTNYQILTMSDPRAKKLEKWMFLAKVEKGAM